MCWKPRSTTDCSTCEKKKRRWRKGKEERKWQFRHPSICMCHYYYRSTRRHNALKLNPYHAYGRKLMLSLTCQKTERTKFNQALKKVLSRRGMVISHSTDSLGAGSSRVRNPLKMRFSVPLQVNPPTPHHHPHQYKRDRGFFPEVKRAELSFDQPFPVFHC